MSQGGAQGSGQAGCNLDLVIHAFRCVLILLIGKLNCVVDTRGTKILVTSRVCQWVALFSFTFVCQESEG